MNCPACGKDTKVTDTRLVGTYLRRRRECVTCRERFSTLEVPLAEARAVMDARGAVRMGLMQASAELRATLEKMKRLQDVVPARKRGEG